MRSTGGPGLVKTKHPPLLRTRTVTLLTGSDARWKTLFESADIVSEGAPRGEDPSRRYYGTTDIVLRVLPERPGEQMGGLTALVASDPHVRLRAMRLARSEAAQRATGPLRRVETHITVEARSEGIAVHVELEGEVLPDRRLLSRAPDKPR